MEIRRGSIMNNYFGYSIHGDNIPHRPSTDFLLCKSCRREIIHCRHGKIIHTRPEGYIIECPHCKSIFDDKGNAYTNDFQYGEIVDVYIPTRKKFVQAYFIRKSNLHKCMSVVKTEDEIETHGIARIALNPHTD